MSLSRSLARVTLTDAQVRAELAAWEQQYGMSSPEFVRKWAAGELDDRHDFFRWHALCLLAETYGIVRMPPPHPRRQPVLVPADDLADASPGDTAYPAPAAG